MIAPRGSPGARHSGTASGASSRQAPRATSTPASAPTTLFVIDQPGSGVSGPKPGAYRSATIRPRWRITIARVRRGGADPGSANASSTARSMPGSGGARSSHGARATGGSFGAAACSASTLAPIASVQPKPSRCTACRFGQPEEPGGRDAPLAVDRDANERERGVPVGGDVLGDHRFRRRGPTRTRPSTRSSP